jgi:hypothetical protein
MLDGLDAGGTITDLDPDPEDGSHEIGLPLQPDRGGRVTGLTQERLEEQEQMALAQ